MHARLRVRWAPPKVPILMGGWYPVTEESRYGVALRIEGREVWLGRDELEVTEQPRRSATWGIDPATSAAAVVCPEGHAIAGVAPAQGKAWCERCQREYEIE